jgi:hypothetical protein
MIDKYSVASPSRNVRRSALRGFVGSAEIGIKFVNSIIFRVIDIRWKEVPAHWWK